MYELALASHSAIAVLGSQGYKDISPGAGNSRCAHEPQWCAHARPRAGRPSHRKRIDRRETRVDEPGVRALPFVIGVECRQVFVAELIVSGERAFFSPVQ